MSQPSTTAGALRTLGQIEAAYQRGASQSEIDALWARYHEHERGVLAVLGATERMYRHLARMEDDDE